MVGSLRLRPRSSFQSESCDWTLVRPWAAAEWTASCGFGSARPRTTIKPPKIHLNIRLYSSPPEYVGSFLLEISSASTLEFWLNWKHISENNHSCNRTDTHTFLARCLPLSLGRWLLPRQGKDTTTICPEPICGPGKSWPKWLKGWKL